MAEDRNKKRDPNGEMTRMAVSTATHDDDWDDDDDRPREVESARQTVVPRPVQGRGFFDIYKPGQGYYTRMCTAAALGILVVWCAAFVYTKTELAGSGSTAQYVRVGIAVGIILVGGLLSYWALALNRKLCDFLIATEGEMKKVNWTSRKEIVGSTTVVITVVVALALILFLVDIGLMFFFSEIRVLRIMPEIFKRLMGGGA